MTRLCFPRNVPARRLMLLPYVHCELRFWVSGAPLLTLFKGGAFGLNFHAERSEKPLRTAPSPFHHVQLLPATRERLRLELSEKPGWNPLSTVGQSFTILGKNRATRGAIAQGTVAQLTD